MSTILLPETNLKETIVQTVTVVSGAPEPIKPTPVNNEYRYYHCHLDWNGLKCKKVEGPSTVAARDDSLLLFVKSYIPERFDSHILKYKWLPSTVHIEEKST
jgi:hypothetical protein